MLVTVHEYEQKPSTGVGGVAHTIFWVVRMYGAMQILMPTHDFVGGIKTVYSVLGSTTELLYL